MDFALSTLILFLLVSPGLLFRIVYQSTSFSRKLTHRKLIDELTWSILPAIIIHMAGYWFVSACTKYQIELNLILYPFSNSVTEKMAITLSDNVIKYYKPIIIYNLSLMVIGASSGLGYRELIRWLKWDRRYKLFRFSNKWHYIVSGECLDFPHVPDNTSDIDTILVDILCDVSGESIIYVGQMFDYYLAADGELESIHLKMPMRRNIKDNSGNYYEIPSRFIAIPYKNIININFNYLKIGEPVLLTDDELDTVSDKNINYSVNLSQN